MAGNPYITPELFQFLRDLKRNNNRKWFAANKQRYEACVREPLLHFIEAFEPDLHQISANYVADTRKVGGSLFRIQRDVRFGLDKSPYKTNSGVHFRHAAGKDAHAPGFYLHLEPGGVFAAVGIWRPDGPALKKIRGAIAQNPQAWERAAKAPAFKRSWALWRENALKRAPKGFDPEHPLIDDLRLKDYCAVHPLTEEEACAKAFPKKYAALCQSGAPLMEFLTRAVGLAW